MESLSSNCRPLYQASERLSTPGSLPSQIDLLSGQLASMDWTDPLTTSSSSYGMDIVRDSRPLAPILDLGNSNTAFAFVDKYGDPRRNNPSQGKGVSRPSSEHAGTVGPVVVNTWSNDPRYGHYGAPPHLALRSGAHGRPIASQRNSASSPSSHWPTGYTAEVIQGNSALIPQGRASPAHYPRIGSSGALHRTVVIQGYGKYDNHQGQTVPYTRAEHPQGTHSKQPQTTHGKDANVNRGVSHEHQNAFLSAGGGHPDMVGDLWVCPIFSTD